MNNILTGNSELNRTKTNNTNNSSVETSGTLAMIDNSPLFFMPVVNYDMFIPTNPFSLNIDYGSYAEQENGTLASNTTFMQGFMNAMSVLSDGGSTYGSSGASACAAGFSGGTAGGSCSVGGGFTSVC